MFGSVTCDNKAREADVDYPQDVFLHYNSTTLTHRTSTLNTKAFVASIKHVRTLGGYDDERDEEEEEEEERERKRKQQREREEEERKTRLRAAATASADAKERMIERRWQWLNAIRKTRMEMNNEVHNNDPIVITQSSAPKKAKSFAFTAVVQNIRDRAKQNAQAAQAAAASSSQSRLVFRGHKPREDIEYE